MTARYFFVMMLIAALVAFSSPNLVTAAERGSETRSITPSIFATIRTFTKTIPHPQPASEDRLEATIHITYPVLSSDKGITPELASINEQIIAKSIGMVDGGIATSPEQVAEIFEKNFLEAMQEDPEAVGGWSLRFEAAIKYADEDLISLDTLASTFTDAARPESLISYLVFSLKTGERFELDDFVPLAAAAELTRIAEPHFRNVRKMQPDQSYSDAGFTFFEGDTFAITENFLVSEAGLALCYNQYEIGPAALGVTELLIPWKDLQPIIDPKGLAGRFLPK